MFDDSVQHLRVGCDPVRPANLGVHLVSGVVGERHVELPGALLATVPTVAVALMATWDADLLFEVDPTGLAAVAQGEDLALVLAACAAAAAVVRGLSILLKRRLARFAPSRGTRPPPPLVAAPTGAAEAGLDS